ARCPAASPGKTRGNQLLKFRRRPQCSGLTPSLLTCTRLVTSLPSPSTRALVQIVSPFFSAERSPLSKPTIGVPLGTVIFCSPSLYLSVISLPPDAATAAARLALVILEPGTRSQSMWPDGAVGGIRCTSLATCLPPCGTEVTPTYVPGLMSASGSFLAAATCASGVRVSFRSLPSRDFTVRTSPSSDEIVPRTRMLLCASTVALESARARNSSFFMGTPPCVARLTPLSFAAFHVQSLPGDPE